MTAAGNRALCVSLYHFFTVHMSYDMLTFLSSQFPVVNIVASLVVCAWRSGSDVSSFWEGDWQVLTSPSFYLPF